MDLKPSLGEKSYAENYRFLLCYYMYSLIYPSTQIQMIVVMHTWKYLLAVIIFKMDRVYYKLNFELVSKGNEIITRKPIILE